jgi:hypothetical protein
LLSSPSLLKETSEHRARRVSFGRRSLEKEEIVRQSHLKQERRRSSCVADKKILKSLCPADARKCLTPTKDTKVWLKQQTRTKKAGASIARNALSILPQSSDSEFCESNPQLKERDEEAQARAARAAEVFHSLDHYQRGTITVRDIIIGLRQNKEAATMLGLKTQHVHEGKSRDNLFSIFQDMDKRHDDHVDVEEFVDYIVAHDTVSASAQGAVKSPKS